LFLANVECKEAMIIVKVVALAFMMIDFELGYERQEMQM
jgi:hypothetical protein